MIELRDYQLKCNELIREEFRKGNKRVLVVAPPGAGKGTIIAFQAATAARAKKRVLIFMHKRELALQQGARIIKQFGYNKIGYYLSGTKQREMPIMIGTVQTMTKRKISDFDLILIDEGHRIKTNQHQDIYSQFKDNAYCLAFTATPFRGDKKGFRDDFDAIVQFTTYNKLVQEKALVPTKIIAPKIAPELDGVHIRAGEFVDKEMFDEYNKERIYRGVVEKWLEYANGKKTIVFNVNNKDHSKLTAEWFQKYGVDARFIDCDTPAKERERLLKQFERSEYPVLCNIGLFTEGISIDDTECIVFNVGTKVLTKWVQAAARGSRPVFDGSDWAKGPDGEYLKPHCLILDFGGNGDRFGYVDDYDLIPFTLDGTPKSNQEAPTKKCPVCDLLVYVQTRVCPDCGHVFEFNSKEKRIFSDETEWHVLDRAKTMLDRFLKMRYEKMLAAKPPMHLLRMIALSKGFQPSWAAYTAYKLGHIEVDPARDAVTIAQILGTIKKREEEMGVSKLFEEIESKFVMV